MSKIYLPNGAELKKVHHSPSDWDFWDFDTQADAQWELYPVGALPDISSPSYLRIVKATKKACAVLKSGSFQQGMVITWARTAFWRSWYGPLHYDPLLLYLGVKGTTPTTSEYTLRFDATYGADTYPTAWHKFRVMWWNTFTLKNKAALRIDAQYWDGAEWQFHRLDPKYVEDVEWVGSRLGIAAIYMDDTEVYSA